MPKMVSQGPRSLYMTWTGTEKIRQRLAELGAAAPVILATTMREEAEELITDVKENHVPVDLGGLKGSGYVRPVELRGSAAGVIAIVRFGFGGSSAPYAFAVHENPRAGKTGGVSPSGRKYKHWATTGGWKYLEVPMQHWAVGLTVRIAKRIGTFWHGQQ